MLRPQDIARRRRDQMARDGIGSMMTVIDIWGGDGDMEHLARFVRPWDADAQSLVSRELADGFLVNVRRERVWGPEQDFDDRHPGDTGIN